MLVEILYVLTFCFLGIIFNDYKKLINSHYAPSYRWANAKIAMMMVPENVIYLAIFESRK